MKNTGILTSLDALMLGLIVIASRLFSLAFPHVLGNFSPIEMVALLGTTLFGRRYLAFMVPLLLIIISDIALNAYYTGWATPFYPGVYWQYAAYLAISGLGCGYIKTASANRLLALGGIAAILFYIISNFGVWANGWMMYPMTPEGLAACYAMGLPFLKHAICGNLVYGLAFLGLRQVAQVLQPASLHQLKS